MGWRDDVRNRFSILKDADKWRDIYVGKAENVENNMFRKRRDFAVRYIMQKVKSEAVVLDIGCGAAPVLRELCKTGYRCIGLDYSADMLRHAKEHLAEEPVQQALLLQGDSEHLPVATESVDCVVCLGVISYVTNIETALNEIYRVLDPCGIAVISYRNLYNTILYDPIRLIKYIFTSAIGLSYKSNKKPSMEIGRSLKPREVKRSITDSCFRVAGEVHISLGTIRINGKVISDGRLAVQADKLLTGLFSFFRLKAVYRWFSDVHVLVLEKV